MTPIGLCKHVLFTASARNPFTRRELTPPELARLAALLPEPARTLLRFTIKHGAAARSSVEAWRVSGELLEADCGERWAAMLDADEHGSFGEETWSRYAEAFRLSADQAAKAADKERLLEWGRLHSRAVRALGEHSSGVLPGMITRRLARDGALGLSKAWLELGDTAEAARYQTLADHLDIKLHPDPQAPPDALTERRGSHLVNSATSFRSSGSSPVSRPVTEPELRGGRLAEYAMYERLMMHAVAVLLTLALAFLLLCLGDPGRNSVFSHHGLPGC
jgi:hypothetical protein